MNLKPFFSYYGGKWRAAPHYPAPVHRTIVEPFAGAAGYSLRHPERDVILVEKNPVIAGIWRYLIGADPAEVRATPCVDNIDDLPAWVPQGLRSVVGFSMNGGTTAPRRTLSSGGRYLRDRGRVFNGWTEAWRERVASQVTHIRHWRILEADYAAAPELEVTWFVDPPYQGRAGSFYPMGSSGIDYENLAAWCRARAGQVIVCEGSGATWLPFRDFRTIKANGANGRGGKSKEVIWP